jgi:PAS domain S-box-containing protein
MSDENTSKQQLIDELAAARQQIARLEAARSELESVENALRQSEERFRIALQNSSIVVYNQDRDLRYTWIYNALLGFTPGGIVGKTDAERLLAEDAAHLDRIKRQVLESGSGTRETVRTIIDGEAYYYDLTVEPLCDAQGNVIGVTGASRDITERVRVEVALQEERDRTQGYLDIAGVIIVIEPDQTVSLINRRGREILGYEEQEILGKNWFDTCVPKRERERVRSTFDQLMLGAVEPVEHFENPVLTKSREERIIAWHNTVLRDETGAIVGSLSSGEDITARTRAEEALRMARDDLELRVEERAAELNRGHQRERVLNALLRLSMEDISLDQQLERALDEVVSIPWLPVRPQGAIFLVGDDPKTLNLRAQRGLDQASQKTCGRVAFGQCLCGRVAASGELLFAEHGDERHEIEQVGLAPHDHYCLPILSDDKVIGTITLYLDRGRPHDAQQQEFLQAVAHTLAGIIERKRVEDALRRSERRLLEVNEKLERHGRELEQKVAERTREIERRRQVAESLRDMLAVLNSGRPLDEILSHIVTEARRLLGSDTSAIYRMSEPAGAFEIQTVQGQAADLVADLRFPPGYRQALQEGEPVAFSEDAVAVPDSLSAEVGGISIPQDLAEHFSAVLAVPLAVADEVYGGLMLFYSECRDFFEEEVDLAVAFADQAAMAIENERLRRQAQEVAVLEERGRLARDLHDSVTQSLYSITLLAEGWKRLDRAGRLDDTVDPLTELGEIAQQALKEMRLLVHELRPPDLEAVGLLRALQQRLGAVEKRAGVDARLEADDVVDLAPQVEECLYRVAIEALNNALKHAGARQVVVRIHADGERVALEVADNGRGFDLEALGERRGMGLKGMRERTEQHGGVFSVDSTPSQGTRVRVRMGAGRGA